MGRMVKGGYIGAFGTGCRKHKKGDKGGKEGGKSIRWLLRHLEVTP